MFHRLPATDESYFGAQRIRGKPGPRKRGRGTKKQAVFGVHERGGQVFTEIVPDVKSKTLQGLVRGRVDLGSVVMTNPLGHVHALPGGGRLARL